VAIDGADRGGRASALFRRRLDLRARDARTRHEGPLGFASLWIGLLLLHVVNLVGPPPPSITAIWAGGIVGFAVIMAWSWWADRLATAI
jgi:hypothetical protein